MTPNRPHLVLIAGPNGAGKSTAAPMLLRDTLGVDEFVNADAIASGISSFQPETAAIQAGRVMLRRIQDLAARRIDFAFESTLASRSFVPWITLLKRKDGYLFFLVFLWLPSPGMALARVQERVRLGGHNVPEETLRRRYKAGLRNFFRFYRILANRWYFYDNSQLFAPRLIAAGTEALETQIHDRELWEDINRSAQS